ncbi:MAG: hypothetical protein HY080_16915 [Gammaproteobacteria bacterium]|nr:hypothetical protein [Gammaproteobacteria bacterium]
MPVENTVQLQQRTRLGVTRDYVIAEGKEIRVRFTSKFKQQSFAISLLAIGEKSSYRIYFSWGWLILAVLMGLLLGGHYYAKRQLGFQPGVYEVAIVVVASAGILIGIALFVVNISRVRIFYSRGSHIALFDILVSNPAQREYRNFIDALHTAIVKARQYWSLSLEQQLAGELRMVRRLVAEGVLDVAQYERAKHRLFRISNKKSARSAVE